MLKIAICDDDVSFLGKYEEVLLTIKSICSGSCDSSCNTNCGSFCIDQCSGSAYK